MLLAAFAAGLITSLHCVGMCGPLACAVCPKKENAVRHWISLLAYHGGRLISYTFLGTLLGWIGNSIRSLIPAEIPEIIPWAFIFLFLLIFLGWEKKWALPNWQWLTRFKSILPSPASGPLAAFVLGTGTPLLPCGPLYLVFGLAIVSGSAVHGAMMMSHFALGTIPLLFILQVGMIHWQNLISAAAFRIIQRSMALVALSLMIWRAFAGEPLQFGETPCPLCH